jgi:NAD(P)-dependent dehydrogenase (short-subunit alcohol dehydrogenase family)
MMLYNEKSMEGKKFLITGASSGIGRATSVLLAACGAELILTGRSLERLEETRLLVKESEKHHLESFNMLGLDQSALEMQKIVNKYGALDGVFHSAGNSLLKPSKLINDQDVQNIMGPSFYAALAIAKTFAKKNCLKDSGSLVFMSSVAATSGQQGMSLYSASKAAIDGMIRSLACELAGRKVRVNGIAAGGVKTEMHEKMIGGSSDAVVKAYEDMHPLGFGTPEDVAGLVVYLMSGMSKWITGTVIHLDGGYTAR